MGGARFRPERAVTNQEDDLRATAESIVEDADALKQVELQKLQLEPEDTDTRALAERAEQLARDIAAKARAEKQLAEEIAEG